MFGFFSVYLTLFALFYQTPAPVFKTVSIPDLKSGIPQEVDIPAPVKAMKCLLFKINLATISAFSYRIYGESKYYIFYSYFLTVSAIQLNLSI